MASITPGVFFPSVCAHHPRAALGPPPHPGPTVGVVPWPPCAGPDGEDRRSGGLHPTGAIPGRRTNAVVVRRAHWRTGQSPHEFHRILGQTGYLRILLRLAPTATAAPAPAAAGFEGCWRSRDIRQRRFGGRSCLARPTAAGVP